MSSAFLQVQNLLYLGTNLFATVEAETGKYQLIVNQKVYGPYESVGYVNTSSNMKSWFVLVKRNGREFININGKEISF